MVKKELANGKIVEAYPLTQAQRLMFYVYNSYGKNSPVLNIGSGYFWKDDFREDLLKEALEEAIARCDTMRLRFSLEKINGVLQLVQYLNEEAEIGVEVCDLTGMTMDEAYAQMKSWTKTLIDYIEKPLHTVRIVHLPDGVNGMYIKFQHLAFDGYSAKMFISDVMAIYLSKKIGLPYPKPMKSYLEAMKGELAYLDSERRVADRKYWMEFFANESEAIYNDYLVDNRLKKQRIENNNPNQRYVTMFEGEHPESLTLHYDVSAEDTAKVIDFCAKNGLSVPCTLMLGLRTALSAFNDCQEDVSFKFMINRRGNLLEKKSGGIRMHFFTLRTIIDGETTFVDAVRKIEDAQNETFRHSDFDTLEMYHIKHMAMKTASMDQTYDSMSFSYHAPLEVPSESPEVKATSKGVWFNNDFSAQNLYLTVKHRAADNGFEFIFEYRVFENPRADLEVLYPKIIETIMKGIENPDIKMKDILDDIKL